MSLGGVGLGQVRWLGGATGAGKSAVASRLAADFGLHLYSTDAAIARHSAVQGETGEVVDSPDAPLLARFLELSLDQRWLGQDARTMLKTFPWFAGERFTCIVGDLQQQPPQPLTLAEGFRLLPHLVRPLLDEPWQALWLVTTPAFRRRAFQRRAGAQRFWDRTSDPAASLERLLERDALFADRVEREARELGLKVVLVDGTRPETAVAAEVARWFRLPGA